MRIISEERLECFDFWSGAVSNASLLSVSEFRELESMLEEIYPEGISDVELNDLFWFEFGRVCEWLGLDEDEVRERDVDC